MSTAAALASASTSSASVGDLDTTFGSGGRVSFGFGTTNGDVANVIAVQPDGKIVIGGSAGGSAFGLARLTTTGQLDSSFSSDGKQLTTFGDTDVLSAIALQPDGKVVAVGTSNAGGVYSVAVVRYNADGSLDSTFSGDGKLTANTAGFDSAAAVVIQPDGKIVVGGTTAFSSTQFTLRRFNSNGSADTTFSGDGVATTAFVGAPLGAVDDSSVYGLAIDAAGKIVAAGGGSQTGFDIARYNADGSPDTTFSSDGQTTLNTVGNNARATSLVLQADGRILVAGGNVATGGTGGVIARLMSDGSLDSSFAGDGVAEFVSPLIRAIATDANGNLTAATATGTDAASDFLIARVDSLGQADTAFGSNGRVTTDFSGDKDIANAVAVQSDGKVIAAGLATSSTPAFGIARYIGASVSIDTTPPVIAVSKPGEGDRFAQGASVASVFSCNDAGGSGVATCAGPTIVDTAEAGTKTFTVTSTDLAGNSRTRSVSYVVEAPSDGGGDGTPTTSTPAPPTPAGPVAAVLIQPVKPPMSAVPGPKAVTPTSCTPPKLKGKTLSQARAAVKKAHCTLGKVTKPRKVKRGSTLLVSKQSGSKTIAITLSPKSSKATVAHGATASNTVHVKVVTSISARALRDTGLLVTVTGLYPHGDDNFSLIQRIRRKVGRGSAKADANGIAEIRVNPWPGRGPIGPGRYTLRTLVRGATGKAEVLRTLTVR